VNKSELTTISTGLSIQLKMALTFPALYKPADLAPESYRIIFMQAIVWLIGWHRG